MDRRTLFSTLLNRQRTETITTMSPPTTNGAGLSAYTGPWGYEQAAHLLRRGMFGPNHSQIKWSVEKGLTATVDKLFENVPLPEPPLNSYYSEDPKVPIGATWIRAPYELAKLNNQMSYRSLSLRGWTMNLMIQEGVSIREKMTLFWHNHFAINSVLDPNYLYRYSNLLRTHALGNFKELTKAITIDPSMLIFLNGNRNSKYAPNENYARELLELFTIGKGPLVGPGDYTHYTEHDIKEIAKVLSGWKDFGFTLESRNGEIGAEFDATRHDITTKKLSHRFDYQEISDKGDKEYLYLIDLIFQKRETARHICRRLYKWFVFYNIDAATEANVIQPMAEILINNNYDVKAPIKALLNSEHFFHASIIGAMLKNPLDYMMSIIKPMHVSMSTELDKKYDSTYAFFGAARQMQMEYYHIPEVAGWRAYYIGPTYYRNWANASTLPVRLKLSDAVASDGYNPFKGNGKRMVADVLKFVATLDYPDDPNAVVEAFTKVLLPWQLSQRDRDMLKQFLLVGLPDYEWSIEYNAYAENIGDSKLANAIATKLKALLKAIVNLAAFQLH